MTKPYMRMFWADYFGDTKHLDLETHGAYLILIGHYWLHGGLPDDDRELARILNISRQKFCKIRAELAPFFGPGWTHKRINQELAFVHDKSMKTRSAALQMHAAKTMQTHKQMQKQTHPIRASRPGAIPEQKVNLSSDSELTPRATNGSGMEEQMAADKKDTAEALRQAAERAARLTQDQITPELKANLRAQQRHGAPPPQHELAPSAELKAKIAAQLRRERGEK